MIPAQRVLLDDGKPLRLGADGFSCIVPTDESEFDDDDSWNEIPADEEMLEEIPF